MFPMTYWSQSIAYKQITQFSIIYIMRFIVLHMGQGIDIKMRKEALLATLPIGHEMGYSP